MTDLELRETIGIFLQGIVISNLLTVSLSSEKRVPGIIFLRGTHARARRDYRRHPLEKHTKRNLV